MNKSQRTNYTLELAALIDLRKEKLTKEESKILEDRIQYLKGMVLHV